MKKQENVTPNQEKKKQQQIIILNESDIAMSRQIP